MLHQVEAVRHVTLRVPHPMNPYFITFNKTLFKISFSFNFGFHWITSKIKIKFIFGFLMKFYMHLKSILNILKLIFDLLYSVNFG